MWVKFLFTIALFYVLTPGVFVTLPAGGSQTTVALTHAVIFAVLSKLAWKFVLRKLY